MPIDISKTWVFRIIVVKSQAMKERVEAILIECKIEIPVHINPRNKFYF